MNFNCPKDVSTSRSTGAADIAGSRSTTAQAIDAAALLEDIRNAMNQSPAAARTAALRLVALLTPPEPPTSPISRGGLAPWQKRKIEDFLRNHLVDSVRLNDLANEVSLSVSHFCRAFKLSFGETPHIHIIRLRLALAQKLMLTTDLPLSQIALSCGLADQAHLTKLFRRWLAETPNVWRRRNFDTNENAVADRRPAA